MVLTGGLGDGRSSYPVEFPRPEAEIWIYNRLEGAQSVPSNFQMIFARVNPSTLHFLQQIIRKVGEGPNMSYPARVERDTAIMSFLNSRRVGGAYRILYAGEYRYPDLDIFYESVFHPTRFPSFTIFDLQVALRDLDRSSGDVLFEKLDRKRRLRELVQSRLSFSRFDLDLFFGSIRSGTGVTMLPITLGIDSKYRGDILEFLLELVRSDGTSAASIVDRLEIKSEESGAILPKEAKFLYQTRLVARPGRYKLVLFGRLQKREAAVFKEQEVNLGDYSGGDLAISDLLFFERVIPRREYSSGGGAARAQFLGGSRPLILKNFVLVPASEKRFRRLDKLTFFFEVYNPAVSESSDEPELELRCRFWKGGFPSAGFRLSRSTI